MGTRATRSWPTPWTPSGQRHGPPGAGHRSVLGRAAADRLQLAWILGLQLWNEDTRRLGVEPRRPASRCSLRQRAATHGWHWGWAAQRPPAPTATCTTASSAWDKMCMGHPPLADRRARPGCPPAAPPRVHGRRLRRPRRLELPARGPAGRRCRRVVDTAIGKPRNLRVRRAWTGPDTVTGRQGGSRTARWARPR